MNNTNIKTWESNDKLYAEWSDRALDDVDRYLPGSIIIGVNVNLADFEDSRRAHKALTAQLNKAYDLWLEETRG